MSARRMPRRVVAVWGLLLALAATIAVIEGTGVFAPQPPGRAGRLPVFSFSEPELGAVEALWQGRQANLVRDARGRWLRHDAGHRHGAGAGEAHAADPAQSEHIAGQLEIAARMLFDRRITPDRPLDAYGLAKPEMMIVFYARRGTEVDYARPLAVLYVGDALTTGFAYYAMLDGDRDVTLIPHYQITLLRELLFDSGSGPQPAAGAPRSG